ncbi:cell wall metabolism sensor histidine kinase WalK [Paenibacillus sp. FJAT-26967]|uniref:sensor histidine kinase n=1 Tax=Paenibacillus sp. FJAT-26967 TaxID=1729690 RepID=UPI000839ADE6|nr:HAMP domain-containing sensor histidine kinase [Paenibacillus sp. FJAT-26967]
MKTLYIRIVITYIFIAMLSSILALAAVNAFYMYQLKDYNERKILNISKEIKQLYEQTPQLELANYLTRIANLGFQLYTVDEKLSGTYYGEPFKHTKLATEAIERVLSGETYNGIKEEEHFLMITGFFENSLRNSIGIPIQAGDTTYALFVRPNLEQQIGEVRVIVALLFVLTFIFSTLFIAIFTRYIVKPVKKLTQATNEIVGGNYDMVMDVSRKDEIGNLARHFAQMAQSLKKLDDMRLEFVANVSHEIQSPLTSIQGFANAILTGTADPEEKTRYLHIIEEESKRLSSLSKQLLTLAALDKQTNLVKPQSFRLDEQIRQILITTEWQWAEKQIVLDLDLPEVVITADPQLLHQVWFNLITNSIKFSQLGGTLSVCIQKDISSDTAASCTVTIRDTGAGIAEEDLPYVFDRFYKADKARQRPGSGSGLGLSIAHKIINLHHGTIEIDSILGQGTTFRIRLQEL